MKEFIFLFIFLCCNNATAVMVKPDPLRSPVSLNATVDESLNIHVYLRRKMTSSNTAAATAQNNTANTPSQVTGFKLYYTSDGVLATDQMSKWDQIEVLTTAKNEFFYQLRGKQGKIKPNSVYRIRASIFVNNIESALSKTVFVNTRDAAARAPVIQSVQAFDNYTALVQFVPSVEATGDLNYTLEYSENEEEWEQIRFTSDDSNRVWIPYLKWNRTYSARLFATGTVVRGMPSNTVNFNTSNTVVLPVINISPNRVLSFDPDVSVGYEVECTATSMPISTIQWNINGESLNYDHSFYTVTSVVLDSVVKSVVKAKSRTRSDILTCVATNAAGQVSASIRIRVRGPGSAPANIVVRALESGRGYAIDWNQPSHPNGNITKYVVYHTVNKDEPLSDWAKLDLEGHEHTVKVFRDKTDGFYVRVQAASHNGPGLISDVIALERDTEPIKVELRLLPQSTMISSDNITLDPSQEVRVKCSATGRPRPTLFGVFTEVEGIDDIESDVWQVLPTSFSGGTISGVQPLSAISSKYFHCVARNSAGHNSSSALFVIEKPGDAPRNIQVLSVSAGDIVIVWEAPQFPNLPITMFFIHDLLLGSPPFTLPLKYEVLISDDLSNDEDSWQSHEAKVHSPPLTRLTLPTDQLKPASEYFVRARAVNEAGNGPLSDPINFTTPNGGPESAPQNVKIEINEANTAVLSWKDANCTTSVTHYKIYYTRDLGQLNADYKDWQTTEVDATEFRLKFDRIGLKPKTFYRIRMTSRNDIAESPPSSVVKFETANSELPIPTDLRATVEEDNTVHIQFSAVRDPEDQNLFIEKYKIEIAATDNVLTALWSEIVPKSLAVPPGAEADVVIDGSQLERNQSYWLRVTAVLPASRVAQSSKPRYFRTGDGRLRAKAEIEGDSIVDKEPNLTEELEFTCRTSAESTPEVVWLWNGDEITSGGSGWSIVTNTDAKEATSHLTRSTVHESGNLTCVAKTAEDRAEDMIVLRVLGPGSPPTDLKMMPYRNQINVSWNTPLVPNGVIKKYILYYTTQGSDDLSDWSTMETDELSASIPATSPLTTHYAKVQAATDSVGIISETASCESDETYEAIEVKLVATNIQDDEAEPGQNVVLECAAKGQPPPQVFYYWDGITETEINDLEDTDEGGFRSAEIVLKTRVNMTVYCKAQNKYEAVDTNRTIVVRKPGEAPSDITWRFDDDDSLLIGWKDVDHPNGNATYILYLSNLVERVAGAPVRVPQLPYDVNLTLRISAVNEWGEGEKSEAISIPTPNGGPEPPEITTVHYVDNTLTIHWLATNKTRGELTKYLIYIASEEALDDEWKTIEVSPNITFHVLHIDSALLKENCAYKIKMAAENTLKVGQQTKVHSFTTIDEANMPSAPAHVSAVLHNEVFIVSLPNSNGMQNYNIYIRPLDSAAVPYWKYEARDVQNETVVIDFFPLDVTQHYEMKVAGYIDGRETKQTAPFAVEERKDDKVRVATVKRVHQTTTTTTTVTPTTTSVDNRMVIKEPPL